MRPDEAPAGARAPRAPVAQVALDAGTLRDILSFAPARTLCFELAHARLDGREPTPGNEVGMRADRPLGQRLRVGIRLTHERPAHGTLIPVTMQ